MPRLFCLELSENDEVLGVREDGYSLHLTREDVAQFVKEYWDTKPHEVYQEYSVPEPEPYMVDVPEDVCKEVKATRNGIRKYRPRTPPFPCV